VWIDRWNKELEAFTTIDATMHGGKSLFQIFEWLRASNPDILRMHHMYIEKLYIELKTLEDDGKVDE
jgi:hypothetical protein